MKVSETPYHALDVSRETAERLASFESLVRKWSPAINLVSKSDLAQLAERHILDSVQLADQIPANGGVWADFGAGGGFPGLVVAILAVDRQTGTKFHLVESDQRKATFLRRVAGELDLPVEVHSRRIEALEPLEADVVSARALAPLDTLLRYAVRHLVPNGRCVFLKGRTYEEEIRDARRSWAFDCETRESRTDTDARILIVSQLRHA